MVAAEVIGTAGLEHRLWLIARDRRLSIEPQPSRSCPTCSAPLVANFRWCQSCGTDFEPWRADPTPAPTASLTRTATLERPAPTTPAQSAPVTAPASARATAPGVAAFVLDPATAATAALAAPARSAADPPPATIRIASNRLPAMLRAVAPAPAPRGIRGRLSRALEDSPFDGGMVLLGVVVGLSIGVIVTLVLLAIE